MIPKYIRDPSIGEVVYYNQFISFHYLDSILYYFLVQEDDTQIIDQLNNSIIIDGVVEKYTMLTSDNLRLQDINENYIYTTLGI